MRSARTLSTLISRPLFSAGTVLSLIVLSGCGGTAAQQPTPTTAAAAPTVAAAAPAASPQRPPLAAPSASPAVSAPTPAAAGSAEPEQTYEVKAGDTLLSIAEEVYGDATKWRRIYDANKDLIGPDPDKLKLEQKLKIPPKDS
jgi:5'-nucleotidase / UDP-sugar diphosphatase